MKLSELAFTIFISLIILSCQEEEPQEVITNSVPFIELLDMGFIDVEKGLDTLVFHINIKDKEGNVGLTPDEEEPPFNQRNFILDKEGNYISYGSSDTLPEFNSHEYYIIRDEFSSRIIDTVLAPRNPYHYNIWVDFYISKNGNFHEFDFAKELGVHGYDGRFPFYEPTFNRYNINKWYSRGPFKIKIKSDQEAEVIYNMNSAGWLKIFASDTLQLHIQVVDRDLNVSNKIISERFTLNGIKE